MTITFSIDNDRNLTGFQQLTLDETAGQQTTLDANGAPNDVDDDAAAAYDAITNILTSAALDTTFITFISNLFPSDPDPAKDNALGFLATVKGASSSNTFIQITPTAGETVSNLFFSLPSLSNGLIPLVTTLANESLYFHIGSNTDFATLTTDSGLGGRIVAAFYLKENATDHLTAQVQMVTFEALKNLDTSNADESLNFSDVLQVSASGSLSFSFDHLPSSSNLYAALGDTTTALLITGDNLKVNHDSGSNSFGKFISGNDNDTIVTSQAAKGDAASIGINSQHFVAGGNGKNKTDGSTAVFTLVSDFIPLVNSGGLPVVGDNIQDIDFGGYKNTIGAGITITQLTGGQAHADMRISLWKAGGAGGTPEEGFSYIDNSFTNELIIDDDTALHDDILVLASEVKITHGNTVIIWGGSSPGHLNFGDTHAATGIKVTLTDVFAPAGIDSFEVTGLRSFDSVDWTVASGSFNLFKITPIATTSAFDLGAVRLSEGTTASVGLGSHLLVDDDGPSITASAVNAPTLTVDETVLATNDSDSYAAQFAPTFGTDGQAAAPVTYALSTPGGNSGLVDTATGNAVFLFSDAGKVVGREGTDATDAASGEVVFEVSVNASGSVTLDQKRAVVHPTGDPNESKFLAAANLVVLTATAHDKDGDTASAPLNIGQLLEFKDDGPSITASAVNAPTLTVDETVLATNDSDSYAAQFAPTFGTDGQAAAPVTYALSTPGGNSGLVDTATGNAVFLFSDAGKVVGREGTDATDAASGEVVFEVSVNASGSVTLDQKRAVVHPTGDPNESKFLAAANLVVLTATAHDKDGDTASAPLNIGQLLEFKDDGPSITASAVNAPTLTVDETVLATNDSDSYAAQFAPTFGTDGQAAAPVTYALSTPGGNSGLVDTATGNAVFLFSDAGKVVGREGTDATDAASGEVVFEVSVNASGSVTLDQKRAVVHPTGDPNESKFLAAANLVVLTATAHDKDGDTASAPLNIGQLLEFKDDGPSIDRNANPVPVLVTDDTDTPNDTAGTSFAGLFTSLFGADGFKDADNNDLEDADAIRFALSITGGNGTPSGLVDTLSGDGILLRKTASGDIEGYLQNATGTVAFTIDLDPLTGDISLEQDRTIEHNDPNDPNETNASGSAATMAASLIVLTATIEDGDGDTDTATAQIGGAFSFEDTGPSAFNPEDIIANPTSPKEPVQNQPGETATRDLSGDAALTDLTTVNTYTGKDGYGSVVFTGFTNGDILQGTIQDGTPILENLKGKAPGDTSFSDIHLYGAGTNTLIAVAGTDPTIVGDRVFTITLAPATDQYTFNMFGQLSNGAQTISLNFVGQHPTAYDWLTLDLPGDDPGDNGLGANNKEDAGELDGDFLFTAIQRSALDGPITVLPGVGNAVIKVSSTGIGVGSQSINPLDGVFIDFIDHAPRTLGGNDIDVTPLDFTNHVTHNNAGFAISQLKPNASANVDVRVSAYNETSADPADSAAEIVNDAQLDIVAITVRSGTSSHEFTGDDSVTIGGRSITVNFNPANAPIVGANDGLHDWFVDISNLGESYDVLIKTANGFERMLVEDSGTANEGFDIERIIIEEFDAGSPIDLKFGLRLTDGDGDFVDMLDLLGVTLTPPDTIL